MLPEVENEPRSARMRTRGGAPVRRGVSIGRVVTIALAFCVMLIASLYLFHRLEQFLIRDPRFALAGLDGDVAAVEISGAAHASRSQIERVFSIDLGRSVYLLPLADRRDALRTVDWVKDASIARLWPNRVVVRVEERKPVAFLTLGPSRFALIDEDGVILPPAPDRFALPRQEHLRTPFALVGFSGGPRVCLGISLARTEVKAIVSHVLRRFTLALTPGQNVVQLYRPMSTPLDGIKMQVAARPAVPPSAHLPD